MLEYNKIYNMDCIEGMKMLDDKSIDMILCDPPYGTTACKWDNVIPFEPMWKEIKRIVKDNGVIVFTASQPFTSALIMSNPKMFKYCWVWDKKNATGHLLARRMPMKQHEDICIFMDCGSWYNPQGIEFYGKITRRGNNGDNFRKSGKENYQEYTNYPRSILEFKLEKNRYHSTQKPVELFKYLIKTYSNENDVILDFCMGSGTTSIACLETNRKYIGFEIEKKYVDIANDRIEKLKELSK